MEMAENSLRVRAFSSSNASFSQHIFIVAWVWASVSLTGCELLRTNTIVASNADVYICFFCVAKILVGKSQTRELHPMDADLASPNEKVYGSNTLSAIGKQLFPVKKENSND